MIVRLLTSDGQETGVHRRVLALSTTIRGMLEDISPGDSIPLPNVTKAQLDRIVAYCVAHTDSDANTADTDTRAHTQGDAPRRSRQTRKQQQQPKWSDDDFVAQLPDARALIDLMSAAIYLDVAPLTSLLCKQLSKLIRDKTTAQMRDMLGIENDLTPDEEAQIKRDVEWLLNP